MSTALDQNIAVALVYLMDGFDAEHSKADADSEGVDGTYELHANRHGGHIGIVSDMYEYAEFIELYLSANYEAQPFPGVIQYEVYKDLGEWIFNHPEKSKTDFEDHAMATIDRWFKDETLKASQPVDATKKESTTMKISDLISQLYSLRGDLGNVDVVITGSTVGKFVDVQEVRRVKTPKRTTVYIGKATQRNPQE